MYRIHSCKLKFLCLDSIRQLIEPHLLLGTGIKDKLVEERVLGLLEVALIVVGNITILTTQSSDDLQENGEELDPVGTLHEEELEPRKEVRN